MSLQDIAAKPPHRVVDEILDTILARIPREISESISSAIDKGPLGASGPHRAIDSIVKGVANTIENVGESIARVLDTPIKRVRE